MFLNAAAVVKTTDEENHFRNSRPFHSFRAGGCKLGFQTCLLAVPQPVSIFLQLVATHKNTCLLQTVQSREDIYLRLQDGKNGKRVRDKLHLWAFYVHVNIITSLP